jgi:hypothetical protein
MHISIVLDANEDDTLFQESGSPDSNIGDKCHCSDEDF